jgi:uncharacterized protein
MVTKNENNTCGECTVCCTLSVVKELNKSAGETCKHCISKVGCGIYEERPKDCIDFECAYLESGTDNISLRPDKCNVMFFKKSDRIFVGVVFPNKPITDTARGQIESFKHQGYSVVMIKLFQKPHIEVAENHTKEEIWKEYINSLNINGNI